MTGQFSLENFTPKTYSACMIVHECGVGLLQGFVDAKQYCGISSAEFVICMHVDATLQAVDMPASSTCVQATTCDTGHDKAGGTDLEEVSVCCLLVLNSPVYPGQLGFALFDILLI